MLRVSDDDHPFVPPKLVQLFHHQRPKAAGAGDQPPRSHTHTHLGWRV